MLLLCARTHLGEPGAAEARLLADRVDWGRVVELACQHQVGPLLHRNLQRLRGPRSDESWQRLQHVVMMNASRGFQLTRELVSLLADLSAAGIRALPFKGAVLAASAYGSVGLRPFNDIDLLVHPRDAAATARILTRRGFDDWGVDDVALPTHLGSECEHTFLRRDGVAVDLHWHLSRRHFPFPLRFDDLWRRAVPYQLLPGGAAVPAPAAADMLLILAMHGAKHAWERLGWVCDIAELIRSEGDLDWEQVCARAESLQAVRMTLLGVALARELLDSPVPESIRRSIRADRGIAPLLHDVRRRILQGGAASENLGAVVRHSLFHLRVRDRVSQRLRYCWLGAAPTPRDLDATGLPASLQFLNYFTRPVRLLGKHLRAA